MRSDEAPLSHSDDDDNQDVKRCDVQCLLQRSHDDYCFLAIVVVLSAFGVDDPQLLDIDIWSCFQGSIELNSVYYH